ncbi:hypothetical protein H6F43_00555 [Leptolyngbya sp. FACHB-36]|uniref:hypothetical protein n=1 Tax=Leptolyngbya sp. FACHB-36 TaxID=2692808 RepID=UPI0016807860|nr:hypothetical protein [Leptolyngbya sp. FACHB-36]MBD2018674.1 hypothetical protein [Leptolyngbya sp. FACHB-36]
MRRFLALSIDGINLKISEFASSGYEVTYADAGDVSYSLAGFAVVDGPAYEPKRVWTITAFLTLAEWQQLQFIYVRSERKRRQPPTGFGIACDDTVQPVIEDSNARTRAIVPGGTVTQFVSGGITYPARFSVRMFQPKATELAGLKPFQTSFVLKELDKVAP